MFHGLVAQQVVSVVELFATRWVGADVEGFRDDVGRRTGRGFVRVLVQEATERNIQKQKKGIRCIVTKTKDRTKRIIASTFRFVILIVPNY